MTDAIVILALLSFYGLASRRLAALNVTGPMVFLLAGIVLGEVGVVNLRADEQLVLLAAEVALVVILFTDAQRIELRQIGSLPVRLLGIGMPLTILAGGVAALLLLGGLEFWEAGVLAVLLAPTDSSLGAAVVSNPRVPVRIRQALNVEGGLNDGIAVPFLFLFVALASTEEGGSAGFWAEFALKQIGWGVLVGVAIGALGGFLGREAVSRDWATRQFRQLAVPSIALLAWATAGELEGSGFIAAFAAGLAASQLYKEPDERDFDFAVGLGETLSLVVFFVAGAALVLDAVQGLTWQIAAYVALSLTLVRMLPVAISLLGTGLDRVTHLFVGWFGPRGLASIILVLVVLDEEAHLAGFELIRTVVILTVALSIIVHGLSAGPLSRLYGRHADRMSPGEAAMQAAHEHPTLAATTPPSPPGRSSRRPTRHSSPPLTPQS
jgi:sodium/hydrogen antiporter